MGQPISSSRFKIKLFVRLNPGIEKEDGHKNSTEVLLSVEGLLIITNVFLILTSVWYYHLLI